MLRSIVLFRVRIPSEFVCASVAAAAQVACSASSATPSASIQSASEATAPAVGVSPSPEQRTLDPLPASACTITVDAGALTVVPISHGFSPRIDGTRLPLTIDFASHFRAAFLADSPYVEIEHEHTELLSLRGQAAFEDVRLFPPHAIQLTPWLVVRRAYATRVLGDRLELGFELPTGAKLTVALPALERPCTELDPRLAHMSTDGVPWCELRHRMLRANLDVALFDLQDKTQLGTVRVDAPTIVAVLEESGKRAKITLTPPSRDTMLTAWIDASQLGEPVKGCSMPEPAMRSQTPSWICKDGTPLTFLGATGQPERLVGFTRVGRWTSLDKNVCANEHGDDLVLDRCTVRDAPVVAGRLVIRHFAEHCDPAGRATPAQPKKVLGNDR